MSGSREEFIEGSTHFSEKPSNKISKNDGLVGFVVTRRRGNRSKVPQVCLPLIQVLVGGLGIHEKHPWGAFDQPSSVKNANATILHGLDGCGELRIGGFQLLDFHSGLWMSALERTNMYASPAGRRETHGLVVERSDQGIAVAILGRCHWRLGLDDGVNSADYRSVRRCEKSIGSPREAQTHLDERPRWRSQRGGGS